MKLSVILFYLEDTYIHYAIWYTKGDIRKLASMLNSLYLSTPNGRELYGAVAVNPKELIDEFIALFSNIEITSVTQLRALCAAMEETASRSFALSTRSDPKMLEIPDWNLVYEFGKSLRGGAYPGNILESPHVIEAVRRAKEDSNKLYLIRNLVGRNADVRQKEELSSLKKSLEEKHTKPKLRG